MSLFIRTKLGAHGEPLGTVEVTSTTKTGRLREPWEEITPRQARRMAVELLQAAERAEAKR